MCLCGGRFLISIHAAHAGSDCLPPWRLWIFKNFNPRCPCGQRQPSAFNSQQHCCYFNPRCPCGQRLKVSLFDTFSEVISIHAAHAGSDIKTCCRKRFYTGFQSTLPMRAATRTFSPWLYKHNHFNPRCPCGQRQYINRKTNTRTANFNPRCPCGQRQAAYSTQKRSCFDFNPRCPCGQRQRPARFPAPVAKISIHAAHAGSDIGVLLVMVYHSISIHAAHAGSDQGSVPRLSSG